jgi:hypothetical protein
LAKQEPKKEIVNTTVAQVKTSAAPKKAPVAPKKEDPKPTLPPKLDT